jgi:transposase
VGSVEFDAQFRLKILEKELLLAHQKISIQDQKFQAELAAKDSALAQKDSALAQKDSALAQKDFLIFLLEEKYRLVMMRRFARSAENWAKVGQIPLFDESELESGLPPETEEESIQITAHTRKSLPRKRAELPEGLEVVEVIHALPESELVGPNGEQFIEIGREVSEKLDVIPMDLRIIQHIRLKYAVKNKEELGIKVAPMPHQLIPKGIASPGLLAHIAQAKYEHHLPLYRQEQIWADLDIRMPRNSMCQWMMAVGEKLGPMLDYLMEDMKIVGYLHADETPVTLLKDPNKKPDNPSHQGYMWVYANSEGVRYDYRNSREGKHPLEMLENFSGYLQVDGYYGYDHLFKNGRIIEVGCMAHARRKFTDIQKSAGKKAKLPVVEHVLNLITKLYHLEKIFKEKALNHDQITQERQEKSEPLLYKIHAYVTEQIPKTPPQGSLGKALQYVLNHWGPLTKYLENGKLDIDNNAAERCIKPFAVGRKNWLFCGNVRGAQAAANIYSLIESAKIHDLKVFEYLKHVFEELPHADTPKKVEALLPKYVAENHPEFKKMRPPVQIKLFD